MSLASARVDGLESCHLLVAAITKGLLARGFAAAKEHLALLFGLIPDRRKTGVLVRTIAKWLRGAKPAGTPEVGLSRLDLDAERKFCCTNGFVHVLLLEISVSHYPQKHSTGFTVARRCTIVGRCYANR